MKRDTMFVTRNLLSKLQKEYHDSLKSMRDQTLRMYQMMDEDDTAIDGIEPLGRSGCHIPDVMTMLSPCNQFDYKANAMNETIASLESNEVTFIISCLMRNGYLPQRNEVKDVMFKMLMALKTQMMDIDSFVIYNNTRIGCNQWSVLLLVDTDNSTIFNRAASNIEFMLTNSGITQPKVIKASEYDPKDYTSPCKYIYNTFTNELSVNVDEYVSNYMNKGGDEE